jgi:5'-nucleotidase
MLIGIDVDGNICHIHQPWLDRYNLKYNQHMSVSDITRWEMHELVVPECGKKIYDLLQGPTLYDDAPEIPGAWMGVQELRAAGHEILFVTAGHEPAKVKWLVEHGFSQAEFANDVIVCHPKKVIQLDLLIDDYPENLRHQLPWKRILFDRPWNQEETTMRRAHSWADIVQMVAEEVTKGARRNL